MARNVVVCCHRLQQVLSVSTARRLCGVNQIVQVSFLIFEFWSEKLRESRGQVCACARARVCVYIWLYGGQ